MKDDMLVCVYIPAAVLGICSVVKVLFPTATATIETFAVKY